jgi:hypothetical protein
MLFPGREIAMYPTTLAIVPLNVDAHPLTDPWAAIMVRPSFSEILNYCVDHVNSGRGFDSRDYRGDFFPPQFDRGFPG